LKTFDACCVADVALADASYGRVFAVCHAGALVVKTG